MTHGLNIHFSVWYTTLGAFIVIATAVLAVGAWWRSGCNLRTGLLEGLRLLIAVMVALTLNQPEWLTEYQPEEQPTLAVLRDVSKSMQSRDIIDSDGQSARRRTRDESAGVLVQEELWNSVRQDVQVVFHSFSSQLKPPTDGTDLFHALMSCLARHDNLRGIVVLSDGDWNVGQPPVRAASRLRMKNIPVFAIGIGSESRLPDVDLTRVDAPTFGVVGKRIRIPFSIESALPRTFETTVTLKSSEGSEVKKQVAIPGMGRLDDTILWQPTTTGDVDLTLSVPPHDDELIKENNQRVVPIAIREEALRSSSLVESVPRWEYRYLRNALERDPGVDVSCLLFHPGLTKVGGGRGYVKAFPSTMEELSQYDVVFLGDVGMTDGQLTGDQCRLVKGLVEGQASGLILMPGMRGSHLTLADTEIGPLYPVVLDATQPHGWGSRVAAQLELTAAGRRSLLTKLEDGLEKNATTWEALPGFQWYAPVLRAKAGSEILAVHKTETNQNGRQIPLLVTKTYGTGKVLFMGTDGAWRWRKGVEDKYHYRFWGQVVRWMAYQRSMAEGESMRLFFSPDRPQTDDLVTFNANVSGDNGEPLESGLVVVQVVAPSGKVESVQLSPGDDQWGLFGGSFTPGEPGQYRLTLTCQENPSVLEATLNVQGTVRERLGQSARFDVLKEIAELTRGRMVRLGEVGDLLDDIAELPQREPTFRRFRLWCHPLWAGFLVFLLTIFWIGRKMMGTV